MKKLLLLLVSTVVIIMSLGIHKANGKVFRYKAYTTPSLRGFVRRRITVKTPIPTTTTPQPLTVSKSNPEVTTSILTIINLQTSGQHNTTRNVKVTKTHTPLRTTTINTLSSIMSSPAKVEHTTTSILLLSSLVSTKRVTSEQSVTSPRSFTTKTSHLTTSITPSTTPKKIPKNKQRGNSIRPQTTTSTGWLFVLPQAEVKNAAGKLVTHKEYSAQTMKVPPHE